MCTRMNVHMYTRVDECSSHRARILVRVDLRIFSTPMLGDRRRSEAVC